MFFYTNTGTISREIFIFNCAIGTRQSKSCQFQLQCIVQFKYQLGLRKYVD